jgi:hypothetical protein
MTAVELRLSSNQQDNFYIQGDFMFDKFIRAAHLHRLASELPDRWRWRPVTLLNTARARISSWFGAALVFVELSPKVMLRNKVEGTV